MKSIPKTIKTKVELARALGISRPTLARFLAMEGAPVHEIGCGWNLQDVLTFVAGAASKESTLVKVLDDVRTLKCRELELRCKRLQQKIDEADGKFLDKVKVESWVAGAAQKIKAVLMQKLTGELPPKLEGLRAVEIAQVMDGVLPEVLAAFRGQFV